MTLDGTIYDPEFWRDEDDQLWREVGPFALNILMAGARAGASALPAGFELLIDWDMFNTSAVDWLRRYEANWLRGINATTRSQVTKIIEGWIRRGDPLPVLTEQLTPIYGSERAAMIAATETTRVYAEGNLAAWRATGIVTEKRWITASDDRVCPVCGPLHNKVVSIDLGWSRDGQGQIIASPEGLLAPPAHVRCRCWLLPVISDAAFERRLDEVLRGGRYSAEQVRLILASQARRFQYAG
jgi:SPP1 gp7 family putative phage head morphogenesis protein